MSLIQDLHTAHKARQQRMRDAAQRRIDIACREATEEELRRLKVELNEALIEAQRKQTIKAQFDRAKAGWEAAQAILNEKRSTKPYREIEDAGIIIPSISRIKKKVAKYYNISVIDLESHRRDARATFMRHVAVYLAAMLTRRSFPDIGRQFGGRDHTTIMYARNKITKLLLTDSELAADVAKLKSILANPNAQ